MEYLISDVSNYKYTIEKLFEDQIGLGELPFIKMDKSRAGVCQLFLENNCQLGDRCPLRHIKGHRTIVCKHYLNGLCKKGDECEYLHEYNMNKMPECYFYSRFGECQNSECMYIHNKPVVRNCPWYDRGFCKNGPNCNFTHERKIYCKNYLNGFCPDGPECSLAHPKWWPLPGNESQDQFKQRWVCHHCHQPGHKIQFCLKLSPEMRQKLQNEMQAKYKANDFAAFRPGAKTGQVKPLDEVTCFKCGEKGHYANRCTKGHLAFLSKLPPGYTSKLESKLESKLLASNSNTTALTNDDY